MQPTVTTYTKDYCPFCKAAKALLSSKRVKFTNHEISDDPAKRREMIQKANGRSTVPQIFIGDVHVGGYTGLEALHNAGGLAPLLRTPQHA